MSALLQFIYLLGYNNRTSTKQQRDYTSQYYQKRLSKDGTEKGIESQYDSSLYNRALQRNDYMHVRNNADVDTDYQEPSQSSRNSSKYDSFVHDELEKIQSLNERNKTESANVSGTEVNVKRNPMVSIQSSY